jgi:RNA polymerase sigma-70 factor, ECF subfamily
MEHRANDAPAEPSRVYDERLRLVFLCAHPALGLEAGVALTLRLVCGLSTAQIAQAFLLLEPTVAARLTRAKKKIRAAGIPFRVPPDDPLPERLHGVLAVVYLVFTTGYVSRADDARRDLSGRAIDLCRLLHELMPDEPEVGGLLALLLLLTEARSAVPFDPAGQVVLLRGQDRSVWDRAAIVEGRTLVPRAARGTSGAAGPYALQASIAAVHADAEMVGGPFAGLALPDELAADPRLAPYHLLPPARADPAATARPRRRGGGGLRGCARRSDDRC